MAAMGGNVDETLQLGGRAQRGEAEAPEGGGGTRRSSPKLGEERVSDVNRQRADRVRVSIERGKE
jgi:hypothetical protein